VLGTGYWERLVNQPVLQFFGEISYGLYLIHMLVFYWYDSLVRSHWINLEPSDGKFYLVLVRFVLAGGPRRVSRFFHGVSLKKSSSA
jgi:peptidoglycan/LPS O-acetylase OafA/YrhL